MCFNIYHGIQLNSWENAYLSIGVIFSVPSAPSLYVYVQIHTHVSENKEAVGDAEKSDFLVKKMGPVIANYSGCSRRGWKSDIKVVVGFGEC